MTTNQKSRKRYTGEFKAQAMELLRAGRPASELAEELGISVSLLYAWKASQRGQSGSAVTGAEGARNEADELTALRRELLLLRQENDILKKAAVILGTKPRPSSAS